LGESTHTRPGKGDRFPKKTGYGQESYLVREEGQRKGSPKRENVERTGRSPRGKRGTQKGRGQAPSDEKGMTSSMFRANAWRDRDARRGGGSVARGDRLRQREEREVPRRAGKKKNQVARSLHDEERASTVRCEEKRWERKGGRIVPLEKKESRARRGPARLIDYSSKKDRALRGEGKGRR